MNTRIADLKQMFLIAGIGVLMTAGGCLPYQRQADTDEIARWEEELMEADRRFQETSRKRGLEGWLSMMSRDVVRMPVFGRAFIKGRDKVARLDSSLWNTPGLRLEWEPGQSVIYSGGSLGLTAGSYRLLEEVSGESRQIDTGQYLTLWRKDPDGRWRVLFDTGVSDN